jgi:hypothetical protein
MQFDKALTSHLLSPGKSAKTLFARCLHRVNSGYREVRGVGGNASRFEIPSPVGQFWATGWAPALGFLVPCVNRVGIPRHWGLILAAGRSAEWMRRSLNLRFLVLSVNSGLILSYGKPPC